MRSVIEIEFEAAGRDFAEDVCLAEVTSIDGTLQVTADSYARWLAAHPSITAHEWIRGEHVRSVSFGIGEVLGTVKSWTATETSAVAMLIEASAGVFVATLGWTTMAPGAAPPPNETWTPGDPVPISIPWLAEINWSDGIDSVTQVVLGSTGPEWLLIPPHDTDRDATILRQFSMRDVLTGIANWAIASMSPERTAQ